MTNENNDNFDIVDILIEALNKPLLSPYADMEVDFVHRLDNTVKKVLNFAQEQVSTHKWEKHIFENNEKWREYANLVMDAAFEKPEYDPTIVRSHIEKWNEVYINLTSMIDQNFITSGQNNLPAFAIKVLITETNYKKLFNTIPTLAHGKEKHLLKKYFQALMTIDPTLKKFGENGYTKLWMTANVYYPAKLVPVILMSLLPDFTYHVNIYMHAFYITMAKLFAAKYRTNVRYTDPAIWQKALELVSSSARIKQYDFNFARYFKELAYQLTYSWYLRRIAQGNLKTFKDLNIELYNKGTQPARILITAYYRAQTMYKSQTHSGPIFTGDKAESEQKEKEFTLADIPTTMQAKISSLIHDFALEFEPDKELIEYIHLRYIQKQLSLDLLTKIANELHKPEFRQPIETILATVIAKSGLPVVTITNMDQLIDIALSTFIGKDKSSQAFNNAVDKIYNSLKKHIHELTTVSKQTEQTVKWFVVAYIIAWIIKHI